MSEAGHDLHALFPNESAILHALKMEDAHFRDLADRYHDIGLEIQRIESGVAPASDERIEILKKERLELLDAVAGLIAARKAE